MRTLFAAFLAAFLILAVSHASALELKNPAAVEQLDAGFLQSGGITLSGGVFDSVSINITTPQSRDNQEVSALSAGTLADDGFGNKKLSLTQKNPAGIFRYDVRGTAKISAIHTYSIPGSYTVPDSAKRYLFPTNHIQSDSQEIKQLAKEITRGANTDFQKISLLAIWVHNNVNYTISLGGEAKDALWVLHNRIGTCDEFSALFIALARSIGIPAKYVSGYVYGPDGWQKHAWAEVYLGKWIPVDPTWLEAGRLDATHIKFFETDDNYVANEAKAYGTQGGKISWLAEETILDIANYREMMPADYNVSISAERLSGGKDIVVVAEIMPEEYLVDKITLEPCTGVEVLKIGEKRESVVLEPKKRTIAAWKLSVNSGLDKNTVYTCPIVLSSNALKKKTISFEADPRVSGTSRVRANLEKVFFSIGEDIRIDVDVQAFSGSSETIGIVADDFFEERTVMSAGKLQFIVPAKSAGEHTLIVYDSSGSVGEINYTVQETGNVFIEKIEGPGSAPLNSVPELRVVVKNGMHTPQNIRLDLKINDVVAPSESFLVPADSSFPVNFSVPSDVLGDVKLSFRLVADSVEEAVKTVRIYDTPSVSVGGGYDSGAKKAELTLVSQKDEARNVSALVGGKKGFLASLSGEGKLLFDVPAGDYDVSVEYEDAGGKKYELKRRVAFEENFFGRLIYIIRQLLGMR